MLNWLRFLWIWFSSRFRSRLSSILETSELNLRVGFFDADLTMANNSSFLRLMELGRLDFMARSGFLPHLIRNRWSLPLASVHVLYRRPLKRWQKFTLKTRLLYWQDEWVLVEQLIEASGKVYAKAVLKSVFLEKGKKIKFQDAFTRIGFKEMPEPLASNGKLYNQLDVLLKEHT